MSDTAERAFLEVGLNGIIDRLAGDLDAANAKIERLCAREAELVAAGNAAFLAMCSYRDNADEEVFQDAIDEFGVALAKVEGK